MRETIKTIIGWQLFFPIASGIALLGVGLFIWWLDYRGHKKFMKSFDKPELTSDDVAYIDSYPQEDFPINKPTGQQEQINLSAIIHSPTANGDDIVKAWKKLYPSHKAEVYARKPLIIYDDNLERYFNADGIEIAKSALGSYIMDSNKDFLGMDEKEYLALNEGEKEIIRRYYSEMDQSQLPKL